MKPETQRLLDLEALGSNLNMIRIMMDRFLADAINLYADDLNDEVRLKIIKHVKKAQKKVDRATEVVEEAAYEEFPEIFCEEKDND